MTPIQELAGNVATEIQQLATKYPFVEARFHKVYELNELPHQAFISLYTEYKEFDSGNIFYGDNSEADIGLNISTSKKQNKKFITALEDMLPLDWCYMSELLSLGFDKPGASDVSARFDFANLLEALESIQSE